MNYWFKSLALVAMLAVGSIAVPQFVVTVDKEAKSAQRTFTKKLNVAETLARR